MKKNRPEVPMWFGGKEEIVTTNFDPLLSSCDLVKVRNKLLTHVRGVPIGQIPRILAFYKSEGMSVRTGISMRFL